MLDLNQVRQRFDEVNAALERRGLHAPLEEFRDLDEGRRSLLGRVEALKRTRNEESRRIGELVKSGGDAATLRAQVREVGEEISRLEFELGTSEERLQTLMREIPNLPHSSVPTGSNSDDNPVVRTWGEPKHPTFNVKPHWEIGTELGILDFERAAKITGTRFVLYFGDGARLERALIQFMLDLHITEHGYTEVLPPFMVNPQAMFGTGQLPKFEADLFRTEPGGYYLIPTAEVPVTNIHADEILAADALPIAYCAYTPCFRSEAGSYGRDVRGLIRQHQFNKVELVRFARPEESYDQLELLTGHAESVLRRLELPYRVVTLCSGDLGFSAAKTYDIEAWLAGQGVYREISSCSNFEEFQARRAKIRFRRHEGDRPELLHTLNGSGLAVGRTLVAILEGCQQEDGSILIPAALRPYLGGQERIVARRHFGS